MPKHLTDPDLHSSWLYRLPDKYRRPTSRTVEFPARPLESATGGPTGSGGFPSSPPVPVGHLTLIDRIREARKERDCA